MVSEKLKRIFLISIPIFVAHGLEEYFANFYDVDPAFKFFFSPFESMSILQATFLLFQIMIWLLLAISFLLITHEKWRLRLMIVLGLIYILELSHLWQTLISRNYYPGAITALLFPVVGFLFWKELLKNLGWKTS